MTNIQFSTNQVSGWDGAEKRIEKALGEYSKSPIAPQFIEYLLEMVKSGKIRVGDPMMYGGNAPIYPTEKCSGEEQQEIARRWEEFASKC